MVNSAWSDLPVKVPLRTPSLLLPPELMFTFQYYSQRWVCLERYCLVRWALKRSPCKEQTLRRPSQFCVAIVERMKDNMTST